MANLAKTIYLCAALHAGLTDCRAIYRSESLDFDIVFENSDSRLHDLVLPAVVSFREPEAIAADYHAAVQRNAVADPAIFPDRHVGMRRELVSDGASFVDHRL